MIKIIMVPLIIALVILLNIVSSSPKARKRFLACDLVVDQSKSASETVGDITRNIASPTSPDNSSVSDTCNIEHSAHTDTHSFERVVVIGDVHGCYDGLLELLYHANITVSKNSCLWKEQSQTGTVLIQVGDLVDRGSQSWEAYMCLKQLQDTASSFNSKVVRLLGNHDIWWLEGRTHMKHKSDKQSVVRRVVASMVGDILNSSLVAAYLHQSNGVPILFTHAGIGSKFYGFLQTQLQQPNNTLHEAPLDPKRIETYANDLLVRSIQSCSGRFPCRLTAGIELFSAGPDRGGTGLGGPFWTDFSLLEEISSSEAQPSHFLQVVGHTMAYCYDPHHPGRHPPLHQSECSDGLIRASAELQSICVDGGLYLGARAYLELGHDGHMRTFQRHVPTKVITTMHGPYFTVDLTELSCKA